MGTVSKALSLLDYFDRRRPQIGLSELARLSGLNKATVHRMLNELQVHGFVEQVGIGREYRVGPAVLRLASLREASFPTRDVAVPVLERLSDATGETAHAALLQGQRLGMLAFTYSSRHGTRVMMEDAEILPLHATASGLAVLAFSSADFVESVLSGGLERFTGDTLTDPDAINAYLADVRAAGMAEGVGGFESDVHSFAVPLFDRSAVCIGSLAVAAPVARMSPALAAIIARELRAAGADLTALWGGMAPMDAEPEGADAG
jgi:DNA-binding IclR family transcriptional regulator